MSEMRRGACPGIAEPMSTGDGLLARLAPTEPIGIERWIALCAASARHGNGIMEVTQRGSLQVRGLSEETAGAFAQALTDLGLAAELRPSILTSPLLGLSTHERTDARGFAAALRARFALHDVARSLSPKVSVLIDGGGALHSDALSADVRVRVGDGDRMHLALGGDTASATGLGWVEPAHAVEAVVKTLAGLAELGPVARGRDLARHAAFGSLRASLADLLLEGPPPEPRQAADPVGTHALKDGQVARGVSLAFGYGDSTTLARLAQAAARCGAASIQPSPGRAILAVGLTASATDEFADAAAAAGFIVNPEDVRRQVIACAGAPACGSATLETRRLAALVARTAGSFLDGSVSIHLSGCKKGCAHPGPAALTLVGADGLVVRGRAGDNPHGRISAENFISGMQKLGASRRSTAVREHSADTIARIGAKGMIEAMGGEAARD
ncbi:MAG: precorrin-3B synthase [Steroidobacteraceae bacterium]|nr:precorrin-3B synthase [Steroidobacteraceae bacterium]